LRKLIGCCGVKQLRLHFANRQQPDRPLHTGVHRVVREAAGTVGVGDQAQGALMARICVDRRGLWLQVANGMRGIHVNGRPVQRMALLRAGDSVYVDGAEILVQAAHQNTDAVPDADPAQSADPRIVLRGLGGPHHGRSFPLSQPLLVGRTRDAALRIDDPVFAERHAMLELRGERVLLRDLAGGEGSLVNGVRVRDALLVAGDQLVFGPQHRFVVEVPWLASNVGERSAADEEYSPTPVAEAVEKTPSASARRWPWLLLAAALLAAGLSALLLFGAR
jgi:pSer/pThr/pTyr-binding forkhead associated (FHA) protein